MKGKSRLEVAATLKDMASQGIQKVAASGKKIAGKVWTVTLKAVDLVTSPFKKVLGLISSPIAQATAFAGITLGLGDTINTGMSFNKAMSQVAATMGKSTNEIGELREKAKEMGATTAFTATEAAEALNYMALAGYDTQQSITALPNVLNLAAAGGMNLAVASDMVTDAQSALGLSMEESEKMVDKMALASTKANTSVSQLGEAVLTVGGTAKQLAGGTTELNSVLGVLADNGVKGAEGGTALRNIILSLAAPTDKAAASMKKLGLEVYDSYGNMRGLPDIFADLNDSLSTMTQGGRTEALNTIFNKVDLKSVEGLLGTSAARWDDLAQSIDHAQGAAKRMAATQLDNLAGDITLLQSAADGVKLAISERLEPHLRSFVGWLTKKMPEIERAAGSAVDYITGKFDSASKAIESLTASPEWQNAETLWDKIKLAWDKLIAEPFDAWWNGTGKSWISGKAQEIGTSLGTGLKNGILALLGVDAGGAVADGVDIGKSFADGFLEGFDGEKVGKAIWQAIKGGTKSLISDAATLLPGGKEASGTSRLSAAVLGYGAFKAGKTGYKAYKGGKAIVNGIKGIGQAVGNGGIAEGIQIAKAAKGGGAAAQSALAMAENGSLGFTTKMGAKMAGGAGKIGQAVSKAAIPLAAVTSAIEMGIDAYRGTQKAAEWTGSSSTGNKVASGVGAALGGTGNGILGDESAGKKALNIGGGALKGAGIGAAVGSVVPVVGTGVGAAVGAGIGAAGAAIGGSTIAKGLSATGSAISSFFTKTVPQAAGFVGQKLSGFFTETLPQKCGELLTGIEGFFTETIPYAIGYAAGKIQIFFTESIPKKWDELIEGIGSFFTESIPNAITAVGGVLAVFFTETVPAFFTGLWNDITGFFTETIPNTLEAVEASLNTFFTETVPNKVKEIWDGVLKFFTQTIPEAVANITEGVTGFVNGIKEKVIGFLGDVKDKVTGFFGNASDSLGAGYSSAIESTPHAEGGIMTRPHIGLVAEDGAEAIIPLSGKRRNRGISLWQEAGERLGVKPYAEGGFAGDTARAVPATASGSATDSGTGISVTIQNVIFEINVNGGNMPDTQALVEMIRQNIRSLTDEIAYQLAVSIQQVYANKPTVA